MDYRTTDGNLIEMQIFADSNGKAYVEMPVSNIGTKSTAAIITAKSASVTAISLLTDNLNRKGVPSIYYDGAAIMYILVGTGTVSVNNFTIKMGQGLYTYWELPVSQYTGQISAIWSASVGSALVTEYL